MTPTSPRTPRARPRASLLAHVALALATLAALASRADAQTFAPSFALGTAVPTGLYGVRRSPGPIVRASLAIGNRQHYVWLRVEGEGAWLIDGGGGRVSRGSDDGTLRALGVLVTVAATPRPGRVTAYALMSAGPQWLRIENATNPYGVTLGLRGGVGVRMPAGRVELEAEVAAHAVTSDFGTGRDFAMGSYVPVTIGVRF